MDDVRTFDQEISPGVHNLWSVETAGHRIMVSKNGIKVLDVTVNNDTCSFNYTSWEQTIAGMKLDRNKKGEVAYYFIGYFLSLLNLEFF